MITKLTPKQEKQIPIFIDKYLKLAEKPTDRIKAKEAVENLYVKAGYKKPIVIFGKNPIQTAIMVVMCKILFKDKKIDLIKDASQLRSQLRSQLDSQLSSQLRSQLDSQLSKLNNDWWLLCWWLVWAGWYAYSEYIGVKFDKKIY